MGFQIRGKLNPLAFPAWAFQRYKDATKKTDTEALGYILERWANLDPEAERYGISLEGFRRAAGGAQAQVVPINKPRREKKAEDKAEGERNGGQ
jgi:hypothetical protein